MKKSVTALVVCFFLIGIMVSSGNASSKEEAKAMVEKAIAFYKANGKEKTFAEVNNTKGKFTKGDLYVFVYDMTGTVHAHGANLKMIGKDLSDIKDPDGKSFVKERIELAKTKGKGWQDYKFTNPVTKKVEQKTAWIEKVDEFIFGCGAYK
jgi:signal transduction histidine kinase